MRPKLTRRKRSTIFSCSPSLSYDTARTEESLRTLASELATVASQHAPEARINLGQSVSSEIRINLIQHMLVNIELGDGRDVAGLRMMLNGAIPPRAEFQRLRWEPFALASIEVTQRRNHEWLYGATLWFMSIAGGDCRWYEIAYKKHALTGGSPVGPFPIQKLEGDFYTQAALASGPGMHVIEVESGPTSIDAEDAPAFIERWLGRLAQAYEGRLRPW